MGVILSLFCKWSGDTTIPDLNLDLESAMPTEAELALYEHVSDVLQPTETLLDSLRRYEGCGDLIRKAISNPTPDNEEEAWQAVQPVVAKLKKYFEYSTSLENAISELLKVLCEGNVRKNIEQNQALTKLLAQILDFAFEFDYLKMKTPSIQNDFSYYRRTLSRGKHANETDLRTAMIEDELANKISLFYAYPTPMLKTVTDVASTFVEKPEMTAFCLRVMVASIILYDHIDPHGAFNRHSSINIKLSVKAIQAHGSDEYTNLMSALRFNTKHLNDDSTPKSLNNNSLEDYYSYYLLACTSINYYFVMR
ncbi:DUF1394-domain-containing protein [Gigaspora margarita]|uniref:DUF1394-domain-containing protein n=1 Tax=Gigaspora margarita TaxID=4874 RepID=A0A8H4ABH1_GIGMA|nr:DUF1394-domain-containing protein [Gigaspora margarita]